MDETNTIVEVICKHCGANVPEGANQEYCENCAKPLELQKNVTIQIAPLPPLFGSID